MFENPPLRGIRRSHAPRTAAKCRISLVNGTLVKKFMPRSPGSWHKHGSDIQGAGGGGRRSFRPVDLQKPAQPQLRVGGGVREFEPCRWLSIVRKVLEQKKHDTHKNYSLHESSAVGTTRRSLQPI